MSKRTTMQDALDAELAKLGALGDHTRGGKHHRLTITVAGLPGSRVLTYSGSTSCHRAALNNVSLIRRLVRELRS